MEKTITMSAAKYKEKVTFSQQDPYTEAGAWLCSGCSLLWELTDSGKPSEHSMRFCPRCGRKIGAEKAWKKKMP